MDRVTQMSVFVAVAEAHGFAAAARKLNLSPPVVTRAIAELEERLGVRLLSRTTRHVQVTDAGLRYLDDARRILEDMQEAEESVAGINAEPRGQLSITAPVMFGRLFVLPSVLGYLARYPDMAVNCMFVDRVVNMAEEGIDVGIRIGNLPDSSLRALRVGRVNHVICGAPDYLKEHGIPRHPRDLARHTIISAAGISPSSTWRFADGVTVRVTPRLNMNSNDSVVEALAAGFGLGRLISYQVAPQLADGRLKKVLSRHEVSDMPIHIVHREGRFGSAKIRSFVDMIAADLRHNKALN